MQAQVVEDPIFPLNWPRQLRQSRSSHRAGLPWVVIKTSGVADRSVEEAATSHKGMGVANKVTEAMLIQTQLSLAEGKGSKNLSNTMIEDMYVQPQEFHFLLWWRMIAKENLYLLGPQNQRNHGKAKEEHLKNHGSSDRKATERIVGGRMTGTTAGGTGMQGTGHMKTRTGTRRGEDTTMITRGSKTVDLVAKRNDLMHRTAIKEEMPGVIVVLLTEVSRTTDEALRDTTEVMPGTRKVIMAGAMETGKRIMDDGTATGASAEAGC